MRVYEFTKQNSMKNKDVLDILQQNGFDITSHMAILPQEALAFLTVHFQEKNKKNISKSISIVAPTANEQIKKEVIAEQEPMKVRDSIPQKKVLTKEPFVKKQQTQQPSIIEKNSVKTVDQKDFTQVQPVSLATPKQLEIKKEAMTVSTFSAVTGKPASDIIIVLLRKGIMATKNQILPAETVAFLAEHYQISLMQQQKAQKQETHVSQVLKDDSLEADLVPRKPVVVVVGHVDHGKTTLLDYIRKTRVAAREKGGITQHLGAYEAQTEFGSIVFIDTPGHEAFSMMRVHGINVADIVILIVAADDGMMPQTLEALRLAQDANLTIVVAINKIDKVAPARIEEIYKQLSQHNLLVEAWGGQIVCVGISAKTGKNVDKLLEMVSLQAELLELKANLKRPAIGYVLESLMERGRGPVATVILRHGILKVGDHFSTGNMFGRVSSLIDSYGVNVQHIGPSEPVRVAGFPKMPKVGDLIQVGLFKEVQHQAHIVENKEFADASKSSGQLFLNENGLAIILKTDSLSTQEALVTALQKISGKAFKKLSLVRTGVGAINESDVEFAADTGAIIYALHVKIESNAALLAQQHNIDVRQFHIIYKLLEDVEVIAERGKPIKMITKKNGEAIVLKVFDIKKIGIVAGARVVSGVLTKDSKLVVMRGKAKIGEGKIMSLQRDKKSVKEVHKGFECAFMLADFTDWQVDDRVESFIQVPESSSK